MPARFTTAAVCLNALLFSFAFAADKPAQIQARVLYGTAAKEQHSADIELWIRKAVEKAGSPMARPYTGWIALTGEFQRLYTSKKGGFIIDGKVTERNGKYQVEIDACEGVPLGQRVTLKAGERRVIQLMDDDAPTNVFIALEAPLSDKAK